MLEKISFIVKTFKRYNCLEKLLESLYLFYPDAEVIIADDNERLDRKFYKKWDKATVIKLPFDSGLSMGRNEAIKASDREFIMLLDDDFIFTEQTDIAKLLTVIESDPRIGVVGGACLENNRVVNYEHKLLFGDNILRHLPDGDLYKRIDKVKYKFTECVLNFALFRRSVFRDIQWDNDLKLAEHIDFYLRFKKLDWLIAYAPQVKVIHNRIRDNNYKVWRGRGRDFSIMMFKKNKIRRMITVSGTVNELKGNELITYKIKL